MREQRPSETPSPERGAYVQVERQTVVLAKCEVAAQGPYGVGVLARPACETLAQAESRRLELQVGGRARQEPPAVVPGLAPGRERLFPDWPDCSHRARTLSPIACTLRSVRLRIPLVLAVLGCVVAVAPAAAHQGQATAPHASFGLVKFADGLRSPVYLTSAPGDKRLFVVEQEGTIRTISNGKVAAEPYADLRRYVTAGGEQGLLSVAFSPDFASNGKLYVYFTNKQGNEVVWELHARKGAASIRPGHRELVQIPDTEGNHNGGQLQFGPDGMLYFGDGDGGGAGDQHGAHGNGQNPGVLLGKLLRIDVNSRSGERPYGIPSDNPFVGKAGWRPEIWALGLRNPWRFSFDRLTGDLWIGDVGQDRYEEVERSLAPSTGKSPGRDLNYGWRVMEGAHCFNPPSGCNRMGKVVPVVEYPHTQGCAVTGGYVYRGTQVPAIYAHYVFSDFCSGTVWMIPRGGGPKSQLFDTPYSVSSFGEDESGELYLVDRGGAIYKFATAR
jgi:glucose/arabinose dehydrogenase